MKCFVVYHRCKKVVKPFFDSPRFFSSCFAEPFLSGQRYTTTQPVWTLFLLKSTWTRPRGFQGCQKIRLLIKLLKLPPKGTNFEKSTKLKKKVSKPPVFRLFQIFFNLGAILAHQTSTGMFSGSWCIF